MTASPSTSSGTTIAPSAIVCRDAVLEGAVTVGDGCVVHPLATIRATKGPIFFGPNNLIEEKAYIENCNEDGKAMVIGEGNVFQIQSRCMAQCIGSNNSFGVRSELGAGCVVLDNCSVGVGCRFVAGEVVGPDVVVFGARNEHRQAADPLPKNSMLLEFLRKLLPSYHHLQKSSVAAAPK